jgi:SPP1 gp7 family putative phage head morphogenesis protein
VPNLVNNTVRGANNIISQTLTNIQNVFKPGSQSTLISGECRDVQKAVIPYFLYRPPFGRPRGIDVVEIRNLAACSYIESIINTIITEGSSMDWEIVPNFEQGKGPRASEADIADATYFFEDPNDNPGANIKTLNRMAWRDLLHMDSGIYVKVYDKASYEDLASMLVVRGGENKPEYVSSGRLKPLGQRQLSQLYVYDGATFTKDPDIHGVIPEHNGYWQYYWSTAARPIGFERDEVLWLEARPRTSTVYGVAPIEDLKNTLYALVLGEKVYSDFFRNDAIPPGVVSLIDANQKQIDEFRQRMDEQLLKKDAKLDIFRRIFTRMPIVNNKVEYTPLTIPPRELEWLSQQQWFIKLVWMYFGVTPSEMGITEHSNKATDLSQNRIFKRKAIKPILDLTAHHITSEIMPEFGFVKKNLFGRTSFIPTMRFQFKGYDNDEELEKQKLVESRLRNQQITVNEWRTENRMDPVEWGDKPNENGGGQASLGLENEWDKFVPGDYEERQEDKAASAVKKKQRKALTTTSTGPVEHPRPMLIPEALARIRKVKQAEDALAQVVQDFLESREKAITSQLNNLEDNDLLKGFKRVECKSLLDDIKNYAISLMNPDALRTLTALLISKAFALGLDKASREMRMDFMPNQQAIDFISKHTFDNVKDMTDELAADLRVEFERGMMNGEGPKDIAKRVQSVFDVSKPRADAIARTELNRAFNHANLDGYRQSGLAGEKEWLAMIDDRTSDLCRAMNGQHVPLGGKFTYAKTGEEFEVPPGHVNCRSTVRFHPTPGKTVSEAEVKAIKTWQSKGIGVSEMARLAGRPNKTIYNVLEREERNHGKKQIH